MPVFDAILFVLLLVGNVLALPVWWWLFGAPVARLWRSYQAMRRGALMLSQYGQEPRTIVGEESERPSCGERSDHGSFAGGG